MAALEFITGIASLLGGKKNSGNNQASDSITSGMSDSTSTANQTETGKANTNETGSTTSTTNQSSQNTTSGQTSTNSRDSTIGSQSGTTRDTQTSLGFRSDVLTGLEDRLKAMTGASDPTQLFSARLRDLSNMTSGIDPQKYAADARSSAAVDIQSDLIRSNNEASSASGGTTTSNSMLALLDAQGRRDAATKLAGIEGDAFMAATNAKANFDSSITDQMAKLGAQSQDGFLGLVQALSGARSSVTGTQTSNVNTTQDTRGTSDTSSRESSIASTISQLTELMNRNTAGTTNNSTSLTQNQSDKNLEAVNAMDKGNGPSDLELMLMKLFGVTPQQTPTPTPAPVTPPASKPDYSRR